MNHAETVSWIFYAVAKATGSGPADYRGISLIADGINHAVPTHKELQSSLAWLSNAGLVSKSSEGYFLTLSGKALFEESRNKFDTIMKVWGSLALAIERIEKDRTN
jgi:hypothetical protein